MRKTKKGYTQKELNLYMKRKGLYTVWQKRGMSSLDAVRLILKDRPLPELEREQVNGFLAHVIAVG